jgi:hypothetical protein
MTFKPLHIDAILALRLVLLDAQLLKEVISTVERLGCVPSIIALSLEKGAQRSSRNSIGMGHAGETTHERGFGFG